MINWIYDLDFTLYDYNGKHNSSFKYDKIIEYPNLKSIIKSLSGRKILFTNGNLLHTLACVKQLKLERTFHKVICRELAGLKPDIHSYLTVLREANIKENETCYFFEDTLENLIAAKHLGWKTVYLDPNPSSLEYVKENYQEIDYTFKNIIEALEYFRSN